MNEEQCKKVAKYDVDENYIVKKGHTYCHIHAKIMQETLQQAAQKASTKKPTHPFEYTTIKPPICIYPDCNKYAHYDVDPDTNEIQTTGRKLFCNEHAEVMAAKIPMQRICDSDTTGCEKCTENKNPAQCQAICESTNKRCRKTAKYPMAAAAAAIEDDDRYGWGFGYGDDDGDDKKQQVPIYCHIHKDQTSPREKHSTSDTFHTSEDYSNSAPYAKLWIYPNATEAASNIAPNEGLLSATSAPLSQVVTKEMCNYIFTTLQAYLQKHDRPEFVNAVDLRNQERQWRNYKITQPWSNHIYILKYQLNKLLSFRDGIIGLKLHDLLRDVLKSEIGRAHV